MKLTRHFLWSLTVIAGMFFFSPGCTNGDPEIDITVNSDYSKLIETINSTNKSLTEKLGLIETAISRGFADGTQAQELLLQAVTSLSGTLEEKLAAIEAAISSQAASLEMKLGLIKEAFSAGIADALAQQALIQQAIESLSGTLEVKLATIEAAVKSQTAGLETKLALLEAALKEGMVDSHGQQELLQQAIGALTGDLSERLDAIAQAMDKQTSSLETKLALIEAAAGEKLLQNNEALALIEKAVQSLGGTIDDKLKAIRAAITSQTSALETKLGLIEAAVNGGFAGDEEKQKLLLQAVQSLSGTAEEKLAAIISAVESKVTALSSKLGLIEASIQEGLTNNQQKQELIEAALKALDGTAKEKLEAIETAMTNQADSLTTKLQLVNSALATGLTDKATAISLVKTAISSLQGSVDGVAGVLAAIDAMLLPTGNVGKAIADILSAIQNQTGYSAILSAITHTLELLAGKINGHEFVDLGNGLKWATCNVGANNPWDKGDYFAWGETEPYYEGLDPLYWKENKDDGYCWSSYSDNPSGDSTTFVKYGYYEYGLKTLLEPEDDAAAVNWGGTWRMPTYEEWKWMETNCTFTWTENYQGTGVPGLIVKSTIAGYTDRTIFFPTAGCIERKAIKIENKALVWSSSWCDDANGENLVRTSQMATMVAMSQFNEGTAIGVMNPGPAFRYRGASVRPVSF
jgi:hypothetical protein